MLFPPLSPTLRRLFSVLLALAALGLSSCETRGPFGLSASAFADILAKGDRAALVALPASAFGDPGPQGPAAWYYAALWLEAGAPETSPSAQDARDALVIDLYRRAAAAATGFARNDARLRLVANLADRARALPAGIDPKPAWEAVLEASRGADGGDLSAARLEALAALSRWEELRAAAIALIHADVGTPMASDGAALYARALASLRLELPQAATDLQTLLSLGSGPWVAKGLDLLAEPGAGGGIPESAVDKARLFQAIDGRDYGAAWRASRGVLAELRQSPTRELVGAVGKAWLFSGMAKAGIAVMDSVPGASQGAAGGSKHAGGSPAWTATFYKARMYAAISRYDEAAALLRDLADTASTDKDLDSCLWYALDARLDAFGAQVAPIAAWRSKALRDRALAGPRLAAIAETARRWKDPSNFDDLVEPLFRELVVDGNWDEVDAFASRLSPFADADLAARMLYVGGRARELGLVGGAAARPLISIAPGKVAPGPAAAADLEEAARRFRSVLSLAGAPEYYLLVAAARVGADLRPWDPDARPRRPRIFEPRRPADDFAGVIEGLVEFGAPTVAWSLASGMTDDLSDETLVNLAKASAKTASFVSSMRFAYSLTSRSPAAYESSAAGSEVDAPGKNVFELLYPRPWRSELDAAIAGSDLPEQAAYGLVRSESWFDPGVKSGAGAVGLSQLMPSTAAEIARSLRVKNWSLANPGDNLRLGMAMLHDLFDENDGHILRAAFAYNAGRSRLRRWLAESGGYPDDLFLERLSIAETRDYGRKILVATAWYAALYEGAGSASTVDAVLAGYPVAK